VYLSVPELAFSSVVVPVFVSVVAQSVAQLSVVVAVV
jgi:hypothetical protein